MLALINCEQMEIMGKRVEMEIQLTPTNLEEKQQEFKEWKKKAGWIK